MIPGLLTGIVTGVTSLFNNYIDKGVEDKDKANELKAQFAAASQSLISERLQTARDIILGEAKGDSWLQRCWRPVTMLSFVGMIAVYWMGWADTNLTDDIVMELLEIIKIGLGGYVVGRSVEKVAKTIAPAIAAKKDKGMFD